MRFRAPAQADVAAVLAVFEARETADLGEVEQTLDALRDEWGSSEFDLEQDARVVEDLDGRIVAYAAVRRMGTLVVVAPEWEGRGIGSRLLQWTERHDRSRGRALHRQWVAATNGSAQALLTRAGYRRARSYSRMVRSLENLPAVGDLPAGFHLRSIDPERDAMALHAVDAASFAAAPDYVPESLALFTEEWLGSHDFDGALSRAVTEEERVVGFLIAGRRPDERAGYVHILAVAPDYQDRGLGTAMLRSAFAAFARAGLREARLGVASYNPRGLHVYERSGMTERFRFEIYERPVGRPPSRWRAYRDVDGAADPASLADQLDTVASVSFVAAEKRRSRELLGLAPGDSVLDVGCGTGADLAALAEIVGARGRVVGLEPSGSLIAAARAAGRDRGDRVELVQGDGRALPFADGEFAAARADRTLQHLDPPDAGLGEMVRVTRAGGRVVVSESRWGLVAPSLDQALTDRVLGLVASETEHREWLGYRLAAMFERAGLVDVQTFRADYTATERAELLAFTHLDASVAEAVAAGTLDEREAQRWLSNLGELVGRGDAFAMVLILHVAGTKPGAGQ